MNEHHGEARNRLAQETSPYLLQHAGNPVDWYPWGEEALERARKENKPIFLSVGYSACHWCHVMERESFEDEGIAALLSKDFISIKVDREERPDIDEIYMKAVQAMTGSGGWPMTVFLTPDLQPFFGGTYFPPRQLHGRPGFSDLILSIARSWKDNPKRLAEQGAKLTEHIASEGRIDLSDAIPSDFNEHWYAAIQQVHDPFWGGFGSAPKFPHSMDIRGLLRHYSRTGDENALTMAVRSLDKMAAGGIFDQLGGGFHRYSTDERWLIPHFEKMLYDNALLVPAYLEAYQITKDPRHVEVAKACCDWVLREMVTPEGALCSSQDADSEGVEGKFFVWTTGELEAVLGEKLGRWAAAWFDVTDSGNFEGDTNALWRPEEPHVVAHDLGTDVETLQAAMKEASAKLLEARSERIAPGTDDKVLASWNGLMISALALTYQVTNEARYLEAASSAARFVLENMRQTDGRLFATSRNGRAHLNAYLDDYVFMIQACIDLYESDFDEAWLREALKLDEVVEAEFKDKENGGYFTTGTNHETLIARLKNPHDGALPSGNAVHAMNLMRLFELTTATHFEERAVNTLCSVSRLAQRHPAAFSQLSMAIDYRNSDPRAVVLSAAEGDTELDAMLHTLRTSFRPQRVVALARSDSDADLLPIVASRQHSGGATQAYVCRAQACGLPATTAAELAEQMN